MTCNYYFFWCGVQVKAFNFSQVTMPICSDLASSVHGVANERKLFGARSDLDIYYTSYTCVHVSLPELLHSLHEL